MTDYRLEEDIDQVAECNDNTDLEDGDVEQRQDDREKARKKIDRTIIRSVVQRYYIENPIRRASQGGSWSESRGLMILIAVKRNREGRSVNTSYSPNLFPQIWQNFELVATWVPHFGHTRVGDTLAFISSPNLAR